MGKWWGRNKKNVEKPLRECYYGCVCERTDRKKRINVETLISKVDRRNPKESVMKQAGEILKSGGLVAFPTETVYGLGGDGLNGASSGKIYEAKGRPSDNPLIIHIADMESLDRITECIPEKARKLAEEFWPGPLTMIFKKSEEVPVETTGGLDSVAVRMPNHPVALALIRFGGGYVAAPSANLSGRPSPTKASHVEEDLSGRIDMILDGGEVGIGLESTIVDFTEEIPVILRPGYINQQMIEKVIGTVRMDKGLSGENKDIKPKAPGMKYRHYAPKASLTIVDGSPEKVLETINEKSRALQKEGKKVGIIATDETRNSYNAQVIKSIGARNDEQSIALHLFDTLREFDKDEVDYIFSESFDTPFMGQAIMNRLLKAAGHHVIHV